MLNNPVMKIFAYLFLTVLLVSCATEDDFVQLAIEPILKDEVASEITLDIVYVVSSDNSSKSQYQINENNFVSHLNATYFHRNDIGFVLGDVRTMVNDDLYDLTDNRGNETRTFLDQTDDDYNHSRVTVYIMKRSNTVAIAGIGYNQRALITDEFLYESTSPHEIGHALGLGHSDVEGNIMCQIKPHIRKEYSKQQADALKVTIERINKRN